MPAKNELIKRYFSSFLLLYFKRKYKKNKKLTSPYKIAQEYGKCKLKMLFTVIPTVIVKIAKQKLKNFDKNCFDIR